MKLNEILKNIPFNGTHDNRDISSITHDSRKVKKGTLFIAISGEESDGHDFIFSAIKSGATAIVANGRAPSTDEVPIIQVKNPRKVMSKIAANFYQNPSNELDIVGITGTNGKTTTTQIIDYILKYNNLSSSSLGTLGFISSSGIVSTGFTTPESIELQQILKTIKDGGCNYVPMEISSHALEMSRVDDVNVKYAIFTNLGTDHLDFHQNIENYFNAKLKLFKNLNKNGTAIINNDDIYSKKIIKNISCKYFTYGFKKKSDLMITNYTLNINCSNAIVKYKNTEFKLKTHLIGKFNLYNILASISCCIKIGIDMKIILQAIDSFKNVPGRLEKYNIPSSNSIAIIDYAHSPDAYENIFKTIHEFKKNKKIITIFGCGGNRDNSKRPIMASISEKYSDFIYITNDNPRNEDPDKIIEDIKNGFRKNNYKIIKNRKTAIQEAIRTNKNSIFLILGKGIEEFQIVKDKRIPHSDIKIIRDYINES